MLNRVGHVPYHYVEDFSNSEHGQTASSTSDDVEMEAEAAVDGREETQTVGGQ